VNELITVPANITDIMNQNERALFGYGNLSTHDGFAFVFVISMFLFNRIKTIGCKQCKIEKFYAARKLQEMNVL